MNEIEEQVMERQYFLDELRATFCLRKPKGNKPTGIYMMCRIDGKQVKLSTGVKIYPDHWNKKKQEAYISFRLSDLDNRNNEIANDRLTQIKVDFTQYKKYLCHNPHLLDESVTILKGIIYKDKMGKKRTTTSATLQMQQILDAAYIKESSKGVQKTRISGFADFLKDSSIPNEWENITLDTLNKFQQHLIKKGLAHSTISNYFNTISRVLNEANVRQDIPFDSERSGYKYFKVIKNKTNKTKAKDKQVALTEEQVKQIYDYVPTGNKREIVEEIRDVFVLQCLVGQRIGDMDKFFKGNYRLENDVISIIQDKTGEEAIIPLLPAAIEILKKYKEGLMYLDLSDKNSRFLINPTIKKIAKEVGLNELITYQEQKGTEVINSTKPLYELVHTHTARHTFITILCRMGISKEDVIIATGHTDTTMIDEVYSHLNSRDRSNQVQKSFVENLKGNGIFAVETQPVKEPEKKANLEIPTKQIKIDNSEETVVETIYPSGKKVTETTNHLHGYATVETIDGDITETTFTDNVRKEKTTVNRRTGITETEKVNTFTGVSEYKTIDADGKTVEKVVGDELTEVVKTTNGKKIIIVIETKTGRILSKKEISS